MGARLRPLVVMVAAALATMAMSALLVLPSGEASAAPERDRGAENSIRLASQTSWVAPGQELAMRVVVSTPRPAPDVEVAVAVYRRVTSRSEFNRTLEGRPRTAPLSVTSTPLSDLTPDPGGAVVVRLPVQDPARPPEWPKLRLPAEGVYPVRVELREAGGGDSLSELVTHMVYAVPPAQGGRPLSVALVLPVHAPPAVQPDGSRRLTAEHSEPTRALVRSLAGNPGVPLTIAPTPETLQALSSSPSDADRQVVRELARVSAGRQVAAGTYVPVSIPALLGAGLDSEVVAQLDRGGEVTSAALGIRPDPGTWLADERLDEAAVRRLRQQRSDHLVIPEQALSPVELPITVAQPFELDVSGGRRPQALAADAGLSGHFGNAGGDPVLAAHRLLADLAMVYFDRPGRPRSVVTLAPRSWRPGAAFLDTLLGGLATSPILAGSTLASAFAVPPATTPTGSTMVRRLAPPPSSTATAPAAAVRTARRRLQAFSSMLEPENPLDDRLGELLLTSQGVDLRPRQRSEYLEGLQARIDGELDLIDVPGNRSVTLTARRGEIPVTILARTDYPVRLQVQVVSEKLEFPGGAVRDLDLTRRNTTERFSVQARASGSFPLRVNLVSPDGALVLGRSRLTVRSTAASGVGVLLSVGAGAFLLLWWGRHQMRGRRNRRLVPA